MDGTKNNKTTTMNKIAGGLEGNERAKQKIRIEIMECGG